MIGILKINKLQFPNSMEKSKIYPIEQIPKLNYSKNIL